MRTSFFYIADGKIYYHRNNEPDRPIRSGVLQAYLEKLKDAASRNEWKTSGSGARFTGTFTPGADAESKVAATRANVKCLGRYENTLIYAMNIDGSCGIYRKFGADDASEGIVISNSSVAYRDFDIVGDRMAVSAQFAGESHIGVMKIGEVNCDFYTDGHSYDSEPVFSRVREGQIYFCTAGLSVPNGKEDGASGEGMASYPQMYRQMMEDAEAETTLRGPSAICLLDTSAGSMEELLGDSRYDFLHPQSTADGSLYYVRRPYQQKKTGNPGGCFLDILLLPFRLIGALFGFFNLFSMKYSGKALSRSGDVKNRDEEQMFIDGNMIRAEQELKENRSHGEKNPGIIPRSWELHRRTPDGKDELIRRGVVAYRVGEDGEILFSNGSAVLCLQKDGKEEKLSDADRVTFLL